MFLKVAGLNARAGLGIPEFAPSIAEGLKRLDADIIIVSDAAVGNDHHDGLKESTQYVQDFASAEGYSAFEIIPYKDHDINRVGAGPNNESYLVALGRGPVSSVVSQRLGVRNGARVTLETPESVQYDVYGAHFDDRGRVFRQQMFTGLLQAISQNSTTPDSPKPIAILGDLNAMKVDTIRAKLLQKDCVGAVGERLPTARMRDLATRLLEMASDDLIENLRTIFPNEADPKHLPTIKLGPFPVFQLDHILTAPGVPVDNFRRHRIHGTDHIGISARIRLP